MRRVVLAAALLLAGACSDSATPTSTASTTVAASTVPPTTEIASTTDTTAFSGDPVAIEALEIRDITLQDPPLKLLISTPRLTGLGDRDIRDEVNQYLLDIVTLAEQDFVRNVTLYLQEAGSVEGPASSLDLFFDVRTLTPQLLSMRFDEVTFFQGAAIPNFSVRTINVDLTTGEMVFLDELFTGTESAFALDFLVREAVIEQLYNGEASDLDAWVDPDDLLIPEDFALGPGGFEFSFQELQVGPAPVGAPTVTLPYAAIGVYLEEDGIVAGVAEAATVTCDALRRFDEATDGVFTGEFGSEEQSTALENALAAAADLRRSRPDLNGVTDVLAGWATAYADDPQAQLTAAERDAIEASNDVLRFEFDLCD